MRLLGRRGSNSHVGTSTAECEQRGKGVTSVLLHVSSSMSKRSRSASTCTDVSQSHWNSWHSHVTARPQLPCHWMQSFCPRLPPELLCPALPSRFATWPVAERPPKTSICVSLTMVPECISLGLAGAPLVFGCVQILHHTASGSPVHPNCLCACGPLSCCSCSCWGGSASLDPYLVNTSKIQRSPRIPAAPAPPKTT